ncbi:MAG: HEPN domain-containing protein [Chloroflexi bacterium]|nr:HEPN domain-containing protein [Chloroflexota bacterium]
MKTADVGERSERILREVNVPYLVGEKRAALAEFLTRLEAAHGDAVRRVILFGSQARGDADAESDIDLMIVIRGGVAELRAMRKWCLDNRTDWISEIIYAEEMYRESQRFKPPLYVILRRDGIELWDPHARQIEEEQSPLDFIEGESRMLDYETIMTIRGYLGDMQEHLDEATMLEKNGFIRGAVASLYYAAFCITTAALYLLNVVRGKHSGVEGAVSQFLVKPGLLEEEYHTIFVKLQHGRLSAHYGTQMKQKGEKPLAEEEMPLLLRDGERYIERMKRFLIERGMDESDFKV